MTDSVVELGPSLGPLTIACSAGAGVVFAALRRHGSNGALTVTQFGAALQALREREVQREQVGAPTRGWPESVWPACESLFELLDTRGARRVPYVEMAASLAPFCEAAASSGAASSPYRFAVAMFSLYDELGDGIVSHGLMSRFFAAAFAAMQRAGTFRSNGWSPDSLAHATAWQCFAEAKLLESGSLSRSAFESWLDTAGGGAAPALSPFDRAVRALRIVDAEVAAMLRALRRLALSAPTASTRGTLTLAEFSSIVLCREGSWAAGLDADLDAAAAASVLFNSCDTFCIGRAPFLDLGVCLIVGWAGDARLMAQYTFALAGLPLAGLVDVDALAAVLSALLRFATHAARAARRQTADVDAIAAAAAAQAAAPSGVLSLAALEHWFAARRSGGGTSPSTRYVGPARGQLVRLFAQLSDLIDDSRTTLEINAAAPPGIVAWESGTQRSGRAGGTMDLYCAQPPGMAPPSPPGGRLRGLAAPLGVDALPVSDARSWRLRALEVRSERSVLAVRPPASAPPSPKRASGTMSQHVSRFESDEMFHTLAFTALQK
jgi:hypothetical protein